MLKELSMLLAIVLFLWGCGAANPDEVVRFKGGNLTVQDLTEHAKKLSTRKEYSGKPDALTDQAVLDHAVNMEMLIAEGLERNLHLDPRIRQEIHSFMSDLFLKILNEDLVPKIRPEDIGEEEIRAHYERFLDSSYKTPDKYSVSWLRSENREQIESIAAALAEGGVAFESVAGTPDVQAGAHASLSLSEYPKELRNAIPSLSPGKSSVPVQSGKAWWILRLDAIEPGQPMDFEKRKPYIRNDVLYAKYREAWQAAYESLRREHGVEISEQGMKKFRENFAANAQKRSQSSESASAGCGFGQN